MFTRIIMSSKNLENFLIPSYKFKKIIRSLKSPGPARASYEFPKVFKLVKAGLRCSSLQKPNNTEWKNRPFSCQTCIHCDIQCPAAAAPRHKKKRTGILQKTHVENIWRILLFKKRKLSTIFYCTRVKIAEQYKEKLLQNARKKLTVGNAYVSHSLRSARDLLLLVMHIYTCQPVLNALNF